MTAVVYTARVYALAERRALVAQRAGRVAQQLVCAPGGRSELVNVAKGLLHAVVACHVRGVPSLRLLAITLCRGSGGSPRSLRDYRDTSKR